MRAGLRALGALAAALMFAAPAAGAGQALDYRPQQSQRARRTAVLYFRYADTAWLGAETREITASETISFEHAAAQALVDGPGPLSGSLTPLFPPGAAVLSVQPQGDLLFVTFNEALLNRYADESSLLPPQDMAEAQLRRRLAMASLVNTLTERGEYRRVQVLVRAETAMRSSMRLAASYYLEDSHALPDPLTRDEARILTPAAAARMALDAWQRRDWRALTELAGSARPAQNGIASAFDRSPKLVAYALTPGTVSPDGQEAVVSATLDLTNQNGAVLHVPAFPLVLRRADGIWRPAYESLNALAEVQP